MGIVKSECAHARTYATREETALDPLECIEVVCNIQFNYRVGVDERLFRGVDFPSAEYRRVSQRTGEAQSPSNLGGIN